ncbi:MAG: radical SAM protein [Eubacteriales bacterium]|nr:radical SAM protein [Eubacteriales bacterium]
MIYYYDKKYRFVELFEDTTGVLIRSNVLKNEIETNQLPIMRSFPELIDIGIMGACEAGRTGICVSANVDCYQCGASSTEPDMSLQEYKHIISQCKGRVFQVALGGAGDPNKHNQFEEILRITRENGIIPNYTTSGYQLSNSEIYLTKKYCGAVAVSFYSKLDERGNESNPHTISAIKRYVEAGCVTNIHYVISKKNIKEALFRVKHNLFPEGINAVVFLLYKPVGYASRKWVLDRNNRDYIELLQTVSEIKSDWRYGFDTCQSPAIFEYSRNVARESIELCEAARFSMYIDSHSIAYPCSFGREKKEHSVNLQSCTLEDAWASEQFTRFRDQQSQQCLKCMADVCRGCALDLTPGLCNGGEK